MSLSSEEVKAQSQAAFRQWGEQWKRHAQINGAIHRERGKSMRAIAGDGIGRQAVVCATGASLEKSVEALRHAVDPQWAIHPDVMPKLVNPNRPSVVCVDKTFGILCEHGIVPDYVVLADANVDYWTWAAQWIEHSENCTLFANVCASPDWTRNWKGPIIFTINRDNIQTEAIFGPISGISDDTHIVPAASNVGNSAVVIALNMNFDRLLLTGYDYCWKDGENYYAFNDSDKRYWMKRHIVPSNGEFVYTSPNLHFSMRWLSDWINRVLPAHFRGVQVVDCSDGILECRKGKLETLLASWKNRPVSDLERRRLLELQSKRTVIETDSPMASAQIQEALASGGAWRITLEAVSV